MLNFLESVISEVCFFPLHKSDMSDFAKLQYADGNVTLQQVFSFLSLNILETINLTILLTNQARMSLCFHFCVRVTYSLYKQVGQVVLIYPSEHGNVIYFSQNLKEKHFLHNKQTAFWTIKN